MSKTTLCHYPSDNHSPDIIKIWHGRPDPTHVCGYHYQKEQESVTKLIELIERTNQNA